MQIDGQMNIPNSERSSTETETESELEQVQSNDSSGSEQQPAEMGTGVDDAEIDLEALKAEVLKWQERVPKLALALRERSEELAAVREQLRSAQNQTNTNETGESDDARLQARDQLITELQQKVAELGERHRTASSELHATKLDLEGIREEAAGWQEKWQSVTSSLDTSVANATRNSSELEQAKKEWSEREQALEEAHAQALERAHRDTESLRVRNTNLQETIEFANKQIESLGEDMAMLVSQDKATGEELDQAKQEIERLSDVESQLKEQVGSLEETIAQQQASLDEVAIASQALTDKVDELEEQLVAENERYMSAMQAADDEQTQLAKQLDAKDEVNAASQAQLDAQSSVHRELKEEIKTLHQSVATAEKQLEESAQLLQAKQSAVEALESDTEKLMGALAVSEKRTHEAEADYATARQETIDLTERVDNLQRELEASQTIHSDLVTRTSAEAENAVEQISALHTALEEAQAQCVELQKAQDTNAQELAAKAQELATLHEEQERRNANEQDLLSQVNELSSASQSKQADLEAEIVRLNECVAQALESNEQREDERRQLVEQVQMLTDESDKLKAQLEERAAIVRDLETERGQRANNESEFVAAQGELTQQLTEAQHRVETFQEHAQTLESKLVTQQELMTELEGELSETQATGSAALKDSESKQREAVDASRKVAEQLTQIQHRCDDLEQKNAELLQQVEQNAGVDDAIQNLSAELEREQAARIDQQNAVHELQAQMETVADAHAQELAQLQAQLDSKESAPSSVTVADQTDGADHQRLRELEQLLRERTEELDNLRWRQEQQPPSSDDNIVLILNQQLSDAREENKRLLDKLNQGGSAAESSTPEDLTVLKGIGEKLATQLAELGVTQLQDIADLDADALDSEDHPLHNFKSRILRDGWIEQAQAGVAK